MLYGARLTRELEDTFDQDLAYCTEFDPAASQKRGVMVRFRDSVAMLSPLL